jgi:hypothetical protein
MARHGFTFALPADYNPPTLPTPLEEMIVTVKSAVKLGKKPDSKSAVWVQFLAPLSHAGFKMQLYPRSHESPRGVGKGHDFSILSALARTGTRAVTFLDLGITEFTSAKVTAAMLLAFSALPRLPVFTASALDDTETMTTDHGAARSPNVPEEIPSVDADDDPSAPDGYTRYTPDPSHRGEAMRQRLRTHWLAAEELEMAGLIKRKVWECVLRSTLLPSDTIFQTRFHYKIKRKSGNSKRRRASPADHSRSPARIANDHNVCDLSVGQLIKLGLSPRNARGHRCYQRSIEAINIKPTIREG